MLPTPTGSDVEGDSFTLTWDLDGDGVYGEEGDEAERGDESGLTPTFDASDLNGTSSHQVSLRAVEPSGLTGTATAVIVVNNVAPDITSIGTPADVTLEGYDGARLRREVTFSDPGSADEHTATIDYGDGSKMHQIRLSADKRSVILDHLYAITPGGTSTYTVSIAIADEEAPDTASFDVTIKDAALTAPDERPTINFAKSSYVVDEGSPTLVYVEAELSSPATETLVVDATLANVTARRNEDFHLADTRFVFATGESTARISLSVLDDMIFEPTESAILTLDPTPSIVVLGSLTETTLEVLSDDLPPSVYFKQWYSRLFEGDQYSLAVELSAPTSEPVRVPLSVTTSYADSSDYNLSELFVDIPPGRRHRFDHANDCR